MGSREKEKMKKMTQENLLMKIKLKELYDLINDLERENRQNLQKFKNFIMGNNFLTDESKRLMIGYFSFYLIFQQSRRTIYHQHIFKNKHARIRKTFKN